MSSEIIESGCIGWFGKLPAAGDFLRRNLPDTFVDSWDAWLQAGMAAAAQAQGDDWQEHFLRFPVWYFLRCLPVADTSPPSVRNVWAGILVPSADRVGRLFPLTVAFEIPVSTFVHLDLASIDSRLNEIEAHTLNVLGNDDLPGFEQALSMLEQLTVNTTAGSTNDVAATTLRGLIESLGKQALVERLSSHALFWITDSPPTHPMLTAPEPLQADSFCKLVLPAPIPILSD